jgi:hypothetical protein
MGFYTAWYPNSMDYGDFEFTVNLDISQEKRATSNAAVIKKGQNWMMTSNGLNMDIVILASTKLKNYNFTAGDAKVTVYDINSKPELIETLLKDIKTSIKYLKSTLGDTRGKASHYQFVLVPRVKGPSYSRGSFAVITRFKEDQYERLLKVINHEIGHFWWNRADSRTWQDWLNESFAEYSALMALEHLYSVDKRIALINSYQKKSKKTPAIKGIVRTDNRAQSALYQKGPVILDALRNKIGNKAFLLFMKKANDEKISNTKALYALLTRLNGQDVSIWLEEQLSL